MHEQEREWIGDRQPRTDKYDPTSKVMVETRDQTHETGQQRLKE